MTKSHYNLSLLDCTPLANVVIHSYGAGLPGYYLRLVMIRRKPITIKTIPITAQHGISKLANNDMIPRIQNIRPIVLTIISPINLLYKRS